MAIVSSADFIFVYTEFITENEERSNLHFAKFLVSFDQYLTLISSKMLESRIEFCLMASIENKLFTLNDEAELISYNSKFEVVGCIGQNEKSKPFYFPNEDLIQFEISDFFFIFTQIQMKQTIST